MGKTFFFFWDLANISKNSIPLHFENQVRLSKTSLDPGRGRGQDVNHEPGLASVDNSNTPNPKFTMSEDKPEEPTEVVEEPCEEVIVKKRMTTNACQPNDMGNEQNAVVQPLLTDLYQITMAYAYWKAGRTKDQAIFDLFFRKSPFSGEFTIFAGLSECLKFLENFKYSESDIEYLKKTLPSNVEP